MNPIIPEVDKVKLVSIEVKVIRLLKNFIVCFYKLFFSQSSHMYSFVPSRQECAFT